MRRKDKSGTCTITGERPWNGWVQFVLQRKGRCSITAKYKAEGKERTGYHTRRVYHEKKKETSIPRIKTNSYHHPRNKGRDKLKRR